MRPLVSVIIPTFNRAAYLGEAIDSALAQTYRPLEIIVLDDGSTDQTASIVARYGGQVRYIPQANAGISRARNAAIAAAQGDYLALLDSDDRWLPDKLEAQMPLFDSPEVGLVYGGFRCFRQAGPVTTYTPEHFAGERADFHDLLNWTPLGTQTLVFPRRVFEAVGAFDPALQACEDHDFCLRVALKYALRGLPRTVAEIRLHDQQFSSARSILYHCTMRTLERYQGAHGSCEECRKAAARARSKHRLTWYRDLNHQARQAISRGRVLSAVRLTAQALWLHPGALARIPGKLLGIR